MFKNTTPPTDAPPPTLDAQLGELGHAGTRHLENIASLKAAGANFAATADILEGEIAERQERLNHVEPSTDGGVAATYNVKRRIVELERDLGVARFEGAQIQVQLADELARQEQTAKALAELEDKTP